jgi:hypothetical protein
MTVNIYLQIILYSAGHSTVRSSWPPSVYIYLIYILSITLFCLMFFSVLYLHVAIFCFIISPPLDVSHHSFLPPFPISLYISLCIDQYFGHISLILLKAFFLL